MLTPLVLAAATMLAMADPLEEGTLCNLPSFTLAHSGTTFILSGTLDTPQKGFSYRFQMLGVDRGVAAAVISAGQPVDYNGYGGKNVPPSGQLVVKEKFALPPQTFQLNVRIEGATRKPVEFICTLGISRQRG